jgi:hypothetical protein
MRQLMSDLCDNIDYQSKLREDFKRRRVHPSVETLVWSYVIGKPAERVQVSADVTMNQRLEQELELYSQLTVEQLEVLAAESQALVDRAMMMVKANARTLDAVIPSRAPADSGQEPDSEPAEQPSDTDGDDHQ